MPLFFPKTLKSGGEKNKQTKKPQGIFTILSNFKTIHFGFIVTNYSFRDIISFVFNHYLYHILIFKMNVI